jgi:hypothetical protein
MPGLDTGIHVLPYNSLLYILNTYTKVDGRNKSGHDAN